MRWSVEAAAAVAMAAFAPETILVAGQRQFSADTASVSGTIGLPDKFAEVAGPDWLQFTRVSLVGPRETFQVVPFRSGSFEIRDVPPGSFQLLVHHPKLSFDPVRVDVHFDDLKVVAHLMDPLFRKASQRLKVPFGLAPSGVQEFFKQREPFNVMAILANPMALMMLVMCGLMFIMPKITPELSEEDKKQIADEGGFAAQMLGLSGGGSAAGGSNNAAQSSGGGGSGGAAGARKRRG